MRKNLFQILCLFLFLGNTHCFSMQSTEQVIEEAALKLIEQNRIDRGLPPLTTPHTFKKSNAAGRKTKDIYELNFPGKPGNEELYIIKIFNNQWDLWQEAARYEGLREFLAEYTTKADLDPSLPTFARYIGSTSIGGIDLIVFQRAPGESLFDFLARFTITEIQDPDSKKTALKRLEMIGKSIASFHITYRQKNKIQDPSGFKTKIHADLHGANIFLNYYDGHVTFIDYESLENGNVNTDIAKLFDNGGTALAEETVKAFKKVFKRDYLIMDEFTNIYTKIREIYESIAEGYNAALAESQLPYSLQCTFKDRERTCLVKREVK